MNRRPTIVANQDRLPAGANVMKCNRWKRSCGIAATLVFAIATAWSGVAAAADYKLGSLDISQPWARATPKGASTGGGYMTVTNTGNAPERLSCLSTDVAAQCQIHEMTMDNGVMKMRPVAGGLEIKPGQIVTLKPGGYHVMLLDLKQPLQQGKAVEVTFKDDKGATVKVKFPIVAIGAPAPAASSMDGGMHMHDPPMPQMNMR
jgi:copper(I)-binding protein